MNLPEYRYHPDPISTGSIVESSATCRSCGEPRGYIYTGPVYAEEELVDCICPWCIADGSAHEKLDAEFTDSAGVGGYGRWDPVPKQVAEEIAFKTPGFESWQGEQWFTCCGDAAAFLGRAGYSELRRLWPDAAECIRKEMARFDVDVDTYLHALDKDGSPTAYVFRCLKCRRYGAYSDCD
jgi:uncharacterized protein CbrC (UPF0167 family)